jgi:hypothetical protein
MIILDNQFILNFNYYGENKKWQELKKWVLQEGSVQDTEEKLKDLLKSLKKT